jgi:chemotaxis protein methyltransferase WspC
MSLSSDICERLRATYGLDVSTLGEASVRAAWKRRLQVSGAASEAKYKALLAASPEEFDALVEDLLVPESWFFRDGKPFAFLETWVREQWRPAAAGRVLRVLSVPCAAGQEPYSIAMTLLDAGLRPGQFLVWAGDISAQLLEKARVAEYPALSFRGRDAVGRDHHFEPAGARARRVCENVRKVVRFRRCNLMDPDFFRDEPAFNIVFCRNVLVYFDTASRRRALDNLYRCLTPEGLFFCGHADGLPILNPAYVSAGTPGAFAYRRRTEPVVPPVSRSGARRGFSRASMRVSKAAFPMPAANLPTVTAAGGGPKPGSRETPTALLADARRLADAGVFHEAEALCGQFLKNRAPHADAFFLLGQMAAARGRPAEAENHYRKTLYLNARHPEALGQLALLAERRGDGVTAARFRRRAKN